jgi:cytochrome c5
LKRDDEFSDQYSLVIGVLAIVVIGIFAAIFKISNLTQDLHSAASAESQTTVEERIRPVGQVYLPGEEINAGGPQVDEAVQPDPVATVLSGPQVYNAACIICHGSGIGGAPMISDSDSWQSRVAQGDEILYLHAIDGYTGLSGFMPQKGGRLDLSDDEVRDAVDYMVSELQL